MFLDTDGTLIDQNTDGVVVLDFNNNDENRPSCYVTFEHSDGISIMIDPVCKYGKLDLYKLEEAFQPFVCDTDADDDDADDAPE